MDNIIIIGASSGIGKELALLYGASPSKKLGLLARRKEELIKIANVNVSQTEILKFDLEDSDCLTKFELFLKNFSSVDCIIYCAGYGEINPTLTWNHFQRTLQINVIAFTQITNAIYTYYKNQGHGHYVAISSIAGLRGAENDSGYSASKSYIIKYMEGMSKKSIKEKTDISFTTVLPGFVDTAMAKGTHFFWMTSPQYAASQIIHGIRKKKRYLYVTKRWILIGWILRLLPNRLYERL